LPPDRTFHVVDESRHHMTSFLRRHRLPIIGGTVVVLLVGFLLYRPDKLFVDDVADESLDQAFASSAPPTPPSTTAPTTAAPSDTAPTTTVAGVDPPAELTSSTTTTAPAGPVQIGTGEWFGIDHAASGSASIYAQGDRHVLRFEDDTDIQNGPDLYVWLLADDDYEGGNPTGYIDLGKIKGNIGGQNYELPAGYDPDVHRFVLIWCLRFTVPFAGAPLA
jgi:hypothetical protein